MFMHIIIYLYMYVDMCVYICINTHVHKHIETYIYYYIITLHLFTHNRFSLTQNMYHTHLQCVSL